jgi:peptidoglycan hydrolase-like protein with peptidoglycan-binding domain
MKINIQKNKAFFLLFFIFSFFSFLTTVKPADVINYSAFLPTNNNVNYFSAAPYYDPADFSGQSFPLITKEIPCIDLQYNLSLGKRDYSVFGPITKLQMYLYQNEYMKYPPTGLYLQYTYDGVRNFQRDNNLQETGIVDINTRVASKQATCDVKNNIVTPIITNPVSTPPIVVTPPI